MRFIYTSAMLSNGALILAETSAFLVASRSQLNMLMRVVGLRQHVAPCSTSGTTSNSYKVCIRQSGRAAGCTTMMSEQTKSSEGKFVRMGSAEDTHSFGPRYKTIRVVCRRWSIVRPPASRVHTQVTLVGFLIHSFLGSEDPRQEFSKSNWPSILVQRHQLEE